VIGNGRTEEKFPGPRRGYECGPGQRLALVTSLGVYKESTHSEGHADRMPGEEAVALDGEADDVEDREQQQKVDQGADGQGQAPGLRLLRHVFALHGPDGAATASRLGFGPCSSKHRGRYLGASEEGRPNFPHPGLA
jgi:hypothetical protein